MESKILLVDDEKDIVDLLAEVLQSDGFTNIRKAYTGRDAITLCQAYQPDVVVLDVMLPDMDGVEVCRQIRRFSHCSVLFLSSKGDDVDKILGLASGGDDYVVKPFSPKEIVYRIKSQLRRQYFGKAETEERRAPLCVGVLHLDTDSCTVSKLDRPLELTAKEYRLLQYLMENAGKIISKERLYEAVWNESSAVCDNTIMVHVRHLREKIEDDPATPKLLLTVKGLGYKLTNGKGV